MSLIESLAANACCDGYFWELLTLFERRNAQMFFGLNPEGFSEKQIIDFLRFADILSRSEKSKCQGLAFKVVSLVAENCSESDVFKFYSESILIRLGNFPAIELLHSKAGKKGTTSLPLEVAFESIIKKVFQNIPNSTLTFTDSQYEVFEKLQDNNHFSFSGPTSLGKSFIINSYIKFLIEEHKGTDNIVVLVPSRALINQTVQRLRKELVKQEKYKVLAHPIVPALYRHDEINYVFVFTPERLIAYFSNVDNPRIDYLFVDEAHKVLAEKDSRSPLYYHAILQAERKSVKLFFSSPNVGNPEVFLKVFEKNLDENLYVEVAPVSQNRYFLDLVSRKAEAFMEDGKSITLPIKFESSNLNYWIKRLGQNQKNIIYCNSKADTIVYALSFSETLSEKESAKINELIDLIERYLHKDYYLIDCLRKGIAFHFGSLPQLIRQKVEQLFEDGELDYLFATSTLLEGVNLPAKNVFILSNKIGRSKFKPLDFWNLAGRAGRMTKEMSGNVVCLRVKESNWKDEKSLSLIKDKSVSKIAPLIVKGQGKFYENLLASVKNEPFTRKNYSNNDKLIWDHYANIVLIHQLRGDSSVLKTNFIAKNSGFVSDLISVASEVKIPVAILSSSSAIKVRYQNDLYVSKLEGDEVLPFEFNYGVVCSFLNRLSKVYNWRGEEVKGGWYRTENSLKYYAMIMNSWMSSEPLNRMILKSLSYYKKKGEILVDRRKEVFDIKNKGHVNIVINELISDVDNVLRFKLKGYFENYYDILKEKLGEKSAGANWADYLEYGTTDYQVIELQNIGAPRHLASYIVNNHSNCLHFDSKSLERIDFEKMIQDFDKESIEYKDFLEMFFSEVA